MPESTLDRRLMDKPEIKHQLAIPLERVIGILFTIKRDTDKPHISKLCQEGISKIIDFAGVVQLQEEIDEVRRRRIDPTN